MRKIIVSTFLIAVAFLAANKQAFAGDYENNYDNQDNYSDSEWQSKDYSYEKNNYQKVSYKEDYKKDYNHDYNHGDNYNKENYNHDYDHGGKYGKNSYDHKDYGMSDSQDHNYQESGFFDLSWFWKLLEHLKMMFPSHFAGLDWKM